jgi:hypothetical protein
MRIPFLAKLDNITSTNRIIGDSEKIGEIATSIPSFFPLLRVSETTMVTRGPGDKPAARPKIIPRKRESVSKVPLLLDLVS